MNNNILREFWLNLKHNLPLMKLKIILASAVVLLLAIISCNRDEITFEAPTQQLKFSQDTLVLDTVYNQVRSETYAVKVYNKENRDIKIPKISLQGGINSPYKLNLDGKSGVEFNDVALRKKDSLFIFVEIAPIAYAKEAIAEDRINFSTNQHVTLLSVVQDAEFYIKTATNPNIIAQNTTWTSNKAKIIYGELTLAEGKTLNIEKGTKIYFTKNSGLTMSKNSVLNVTGDLNQEVIFRGDRNDTRYDTIPVNWNSIKMEEGSLANINYAKIFGGTSGIEMTKSTANISNTFIHTFQNYGIYAVNSTVNAKNTVMYNCGQADLGIFKGGTIDLTHCTLANYWNLNTSMPGFALYATNEWKNSSGTTENGALALNIKNSILYTSRDNAIVFKPTSGQTFNYLFDSSLLKYGNNAGFNFDGNAMIVNSIKNQDPKFLNYYLAKTNLRVANDSPAKAKGKLSAAQSLPLDIMKVSRTLNPTIGAYQ